MRRAQVLINDLCLTESHTERTSFEIENNLFKEGCRIIAGIDEAGRGALAGHLCVGLVIYNETFINNPHPDIINNIRDSKKLTHPGRVRALKLIEQYSFFYTHTLVSHRVIDRININAATEFAIKKLLKKIPVVPDIILLDGNFRFNLGIPVRSIIKGDTLSISIASASIVAKVKRDRIIEKFDLIFPGYSFKQNKGYGTSGHMNAIRNIGPSPIHRKTYEPVASMIGL